MNPDQFVNLHLHTEYSLLDGACRIDRLMDRVKELGQNAVAITDHGNMYGVIEFWNTARKAGIKPIIGCEVYVAPASRFDKGTKADASPYHLILLCRNNTGYRNLVKLVSYGSLEGFYNKPRVDKELLKKHNEGLICLSACLAGEIPRLLLNVGYEAAKAKAIEYLEIFGEGNYYIEIQNHGIKDELTILPQLYRLSKETGIPLAATNDCHYINKSDAEMQNILLCIQMNKTVGEPNGVSFETEEFYLKSADEMCALFKGHEEAVSNTALIAEQCNVEFEFGKIRLPKFTIEGTEDNTEFFRSICCKGMYEKYGKTPASEIIARMEYELSVITEMGYTDYFLIVWDFIKYAKENNIPVGPGRGSGAGSLCAYCIGITGIDPIKYNLLFERFLNPERVSMPDFDVDFCIEGRRRVKDYVIRKYGAERVSEIIAFDTLKARAAVRDVGRVLNISYQLCDKTAKLLDFGSTLAESLQTSEELSQLYKSDRTVKKLIDMAMQLEGMPRHATTHAAGVVISAVPLIDLVPLRKNDETVVTQFTMKDLELLGLLKMDFLGLRNLTVIRDCVNEIHKTESDFDIDGIPLDDKAVYSMLASGDTGGVFQFESDGITQRLVDLRPERLEDLIAVLSLYRPGPMKSIPTYIENKRNPDKIVYKHPLLEEILSETYGCIVYQEQVMEICRKLAGYSYGHADIVRRAMAKKKHDVMLMERKSFVEGAAANGISESISNSIFDEMVSFASYAFNKSHAAAYAYLAYQTAYLKLHYFGTYMAALMSSVMSDSGKLAEYTALCKKHGINVRKPDINRSMKGFAFINGAMYFGLLAIKNIGSGLAERIIAERQKNGAFSSLQDFCERAEGRELNKKALENMIKAGAFDDLGLNRRQQLSSFESILDSVNENSREIFEGQLNLLMPEARDSYRASVPFLPEYPMKKLLSLEKEATGMYLSGNPLSEYQYIFELLHLNPIREILEKIGSGMLNDGDDIRILCIMESQKLHKTKKGDKMSFMNLSDESGEIESLVFPDVYALNQSKLKEDSVLLIKGKISVKDESAAVICGGIISENEFPQLCGQMKLCIKTSSDKIEISDKLKQISFENPGHTEVCFYLTDLKKTVLPKDGFRMNIDANTYAELLRLYSAEQIGLIR